MEAYQISMSCFLEDIDTMLPHFHFMFFRRYRYRTQDVQSFPFHVFGRSCTHIQDFQECITRLFDIVLFSNNKKFDFQNVEISEQVFFQKLVLGCFLDF